MNCAQLWLKISKWRVKHPHQSRDPGIRFRMPFKRGNDANRRNTCRAVALPHDPDRAQASGPTSSGPAPNPPELETVCRDTTDGPRPLHLDRQMVFTKGFRADGSVADGGKAGCRDSDSKYVYVFLPRSVLETDDGYLKGLRDAKALLNDGIFSQKEFESEKDTLVRDSVQRRGKVGRGQGPTATADTFERASDVLLAQLHVPAQGTAPLLQENELLKAEVFRLRGIMNVRDESDKQLRDSISAQVDSQKKILDELQQTSVDWRTDVLRSRKIWNVALTLTRKRKALPSEEQKSAQKRPTFSRQVRAVCIVIDSVVWHKPLMCSLINVQEREGTAGALSSSQVQQHETQQ